LDPDPLLQADRASETISRIETRAIRGSGLSGIAQSAEKPLLLFVRLQTITIWITPSIENLSAFEDRPLLYDCCPHTRDNNAQR
jgi:hypothetical protein